MRAFVTGGGGFIGRSVVSRLRGSGAEVRAIARSDASADRLRRQECEVVIGDVLDAPLLRESMAGIDVVYHLAGDYRVGIGEAERPAMEAANVTAAERVLDAAHAAGVARIVHVSTINAFGDTEYRVVDETFERPRPYRYMSFYDETKHRAHLAAHERIEAGAPILIAMPGGVYGPGDHSSLGGVLEQASRGKLAALTFGDLGMNMAHIDDIAAGIVLVGEAVASASPMRSAERSRRSPSSSGALRRSPGGAVRASRPRPGHCASRHRSSKRFGRDLGELVSASAGVTYWATDAKARAELGYAPRDLESGLTSVFGTRS